MELRPLKIKGLYFITTPLNGFSLTVLGQGSNDLKKKIKAFSLRKRSWQPIPKGMALLNLIQTGNFWSPIKY